VANLGPAFDRLALAIDLRVTVTARPGDSWQVEHIGRFKPGAGEDDAVLEAARLVARDNASLSLSVDSQIPMGKGLGSSAAAYVAGVAVALRATTGEANPDRVFRMATELEGHPDQTAAAVYGGLVLVPAEGLPMRLPMHPSLRPIVAVPDSRLPTVEARKVIAGTHRHDVVLRTISRVTALTAGLITGDPGMLAAAHGDEIHEGPRASLSPEVGEMIEVARQAGAFHAARSGAGPSVIAFATREMAPLVATALSEYGAEVVDRSMDTTGLV
jgi:homoserine kinase